MTADLVLRRALGPQSGRAVALVLGRTGGGGPVDPPGPALRPGLIRASVGVAWRAAAPAALRVIATGWRAATGLRTAAALPWQGASGLRTAASLAWGPAAALQQATVVRWGTSQTAAAAVQLSWRSTTPLACAHVLQWRAGAALGSAVSLSWRAALATPLRVRAPWVPAMPLRTPASASARGAKRTVAEVRAPWRAGRLVGSIGGPLVLLVPPQPAPCWVPEPGEAVGLVLRLALRRFGNLVLACQRAAIRFVPVRRVYMVTNVTSLVRVSDGANIPCLGMTVSLDVDSWAWGFSASLPADALPLVEPSGAGEPVEMTANVNGTEFRVVAESLTRERTFGKASVRVQGRGRTAALDAPYSEVSVFGNVSAQTSQQLVDNALPSGWAADWGLTPWLVPGGVWTHQGTPITAALAIAAAGGGYLVPHASAASFQVLPRYPVAPWEWGSVVPDLELPASVVTLEGIEWAELPRYNRVYVSGTTSGGKLVRVTRSGTAGDLAAPMVTDALITHVDAGRQRGLQVLARTGRWADVTLRLPVLPETDVIRPGMFVRYVDGNAVRRGLVRSVSVDVQGAKVRQSIKVESYVG